MDEDMDDELDEAVAELKEAAYAPVRRFLEKPFSKDPPGEGGRFAACVASGKSKALCATIGRRKYGKAGMAALSAKGRRAAEANTEMTTEMTIMKCMATGKDRRTCAEMVGRMQKQYMR